MVAAWISADTGVGPSIASGSHVCNGTCADLPTQPTKIPKPMSTHNPCDISEGCEPSIFAAKS